MDINNNATWEAEQQGGAATLFDVTKRDIAFAVSAVIISVLTAVLGIFGGFALGYTLSAVLMAVLFCVYFARGGKASVTSVVCGVLSLAVSAVFLCTTNGSVRFFAVTVGFLLALVCFDGFIHGAAVGNRRTCGVLYTALCTMGNIGVAIKSLFSTKTGDRRTIGKALIGLSCAIPVLLVVVPLLISSDVAFSGMMSSLFSNAFTTVLQALVGIVMSLFVISYGLSLKKGRTVTASAGRSAGVENVYLISFLSAIGACYLLYLFSQFAYFFSAFSGFLPNGEITYATYARKGFFEMCIIAVINLAIVFLVLLIAKKQNGKVCGGIRALATFIAAFTLIIIATAISKMVLYIDAYGMTVLRLTTSAFMLFLAVVFISVMLRIYIIRINIIKTALIAAGCVVLVLGTVNVNAVCARYNYESYRAGRLHTIDVEALYDLGDEGIPYVAKLARDDDYDTADLAKRYLAQAYLYDYFDNMQYANGFTVADLKQNRKDKGFSHFSLPKAEAYDVLYRCIASNPQFSYTCRNYFTPAEQDIDW